MRFFNRQGKPIELLEWATLLADKQYKIVEQTKFPNAFVITVWLGLNHSLSDKQPPLIFEAMIFTEDREESLWYERYSTEEEAIENHKEICRKIENGNYFFLKKNE